MFAKRGSLAAGSAAAVLALAAGAAQAKELRPKPFAAERLGERTAPYKAPKGVGGVWTPLANPFPGNDAKTGVGPDTPLQMTDGSVIVHAVCTTDWYRLTPDENGDYVNGTWSKLPPMPGGYDPLYFASQVLADGRVVVNGGEYSNGCNLTWTNQGATYDPVTNKWSAMPAPKTWANIGDAQSIVLPNGGYMLANALTTQEDIITFKKGKAVWTATGTGKGDRNDEEGWNFIGLGQILTVDAGRSISGSSNDVELYDIASGTWSPGPSTPVPLVDPAGSEIGPAVLIPNGVLFQAGGKPCQTAQDCAGHTATYSPVANKWKAGPDIPKVGKNFSDSSDGPAVLLNNGHVLVETSVKFKTPSHFFEFDGKRLVQVSEPAEAPDTSSYEGRLMPLPSGQVLWTDDRGDIEVYTTGYKVNPDWAPTIASAPSSVTRGKANYKIGGARFNGLTQGSGYGDDAQSYTNYPLVRITNNATGHVCYARTHDHSSMGINEPDQATATQFDVPKSCEAGDSSIEVVANGMASPKVATTVN